MGSVYGIDRLIPACLSVVVICVYFFNGFSLVICNFVDPKRERKNVLLFLLQQAVTISTILIFTFSKLFRNMQLTESTLKRNDV